MSQGAFQRKNNKSPSMGITTFKGSCEFESKGKIKVNLVSSVPFFATEDLIQP